MSQLAAAAVHRARRRFYTLGGPWYRCRMFEAFGSTRYSTPALFGMDRRLAELMPREGGVFVEAGAHDGYTQSNTYYLERHRGWSGVLVEAVPELASLCRRRRPRSHVAACALVSPDHAGETVEVQFGDLMSTVGENGAHAAGGLAGVNRRGYSTRVPGRTLSSVLEDASVKDVDVLVLDVEGHELGVIAGLDMERHAPRHLLIETLDRDAQQPALDRALAGRYELAEAFSDFDLLYRRRD
ncbi:MAG TPA: FkbM family methyltransferase [Solirubrobacteraceae bacterium]|jgi:FkbM family methyltransferase|nr:FkbM family methyltransferase [Solirubrobacteraceae bacterium]